MSTIRTAATIALRLVALLVLVTGSAVGQEVAIEQSLKLSAKSEPVVTMGNVVITHAELDAHMQQLPAKDRAQAVSDLERIDKLLQNLLLKKALYEAARENGLLDDSAISSEALLAAAHVLANREMEREVETRLLDDYEQQARELFLANPEQFRSQPSYSFTHLLVSTSNRSEAEAMQRILEVHERVLDGQSLDQLVPEFSDDDASVERGGSYEKTSLGNLDRNFARALSGLESPGDVSGPVRSRFGWHIIRLDEQHQPSDPAWEDVRDQAVETARKKHESRVREAYVSQLLDSNAIEVVPGSIERFQRRQGFDPDARRTPASN